jgi:hypothetical protein
MSFWGPIHVIRMMLKKDNPSNLPTYIYASSMCMITHMDTIWNTTYNCYEAYEL